MQNQRVCFQIVVKHRTDSLFSIAEKMVQRFVSLLAITLLSQFIVHLVVPPQILAKQWAIKGLSGTLMVVDMYVPGVSTMLNYAEGLITTDKDNNVIPCLAKNWRWVDKRTIEFKLRKGVRFHNGQEFNAEVVKANWEAYREMENPRVISFTNLPDETEFEVIDNYMVRFTLPAPDALALVKFGWFFQIAPAFFEKHSVPEKSWVYLPEAGPWGTGPFEFVEGSQPYGIPSDRLVLKAYEDYWDPHYPKVRKVIFDNTFLADRKKAVTLCGDSEGQVDIVSYIRPLDTLKIAESRFGKVVKSKDVASLGCIFNQRKRESKGRDIRLRRAVNHAVNRQELKTYAAKGNAYNLGGFIPAGARGHNPALRVYDYDTKKARSLLAEGGYPQAFRLKIITYHAWKLEAQIIAKMMERVGLKVGLQFFKMTQI
jgi:peptide/nickel transport system substrate-binding protein